MQHAVQGPGRGQEILHPEKVQMLDRMMENYIAESGAVVPQPNPKFNPKQYSPENHVHDYEHRKNSC